MKWCKFFLVFVISSSMSAVVAQNESVVLNLSATEFNGKVLITWSVTKGNTCNGISILHGPDTINYSQVGSIEGICGSNAETIDYQFTDPNPMVNATNYYRLSLGGLGFSYPVNIDVIDAGEQSYIIAPNPVSSQSQLIFNNDNQEEVTISFFNEKGDLIYEEKSSEQSVSISREKFKQGVYFFVLKSDGVIESFSGKFSVI